MKIVHLGASKVIIGCRDELQGIGTKEEIETITQCRRDILEVWELDLESPASIKGFADRAIQLPRLIHP